MTSKIAGIMDKVSSERLFVEQQANKVIQPKQTTTPPPEAERELTLLLATRIERAFDTTLGPILGPHFKFEQLPAFDRIDIKCKMQVERGVRSHVILEDFNKGTLAVTSKYWKDVSALFPMGIHSLLDTIWVRLFGCYDTSNRDVPILCQAEDLKPEGAREEVMADFSLPLRIIRQVGIHRVYTLDIGFDHRMLQKIFSLPPINSMEPPPYPAGFQAIAAKRDDVLQVLRSNFKWAGAKTKIFSKQLSSEMTALALLHDFGRS